MTSLAVLTPLGQGAIATVQLVGPDAVRIAQAVFEPARPVQLASLPPDRLVLGHVHDHGQRIDQAVLALRALQDGRCVVDFHIHGGIRTVQRFMLTLQKLGAHLAEAQRQSAQVWSRPHAPIDTEAVEALAAAKTRLAVRWLAAQPQLLTKELANLRRRLLADPAPAQRAAIAQTLRDIAGRYRSARLLIHGAKLAILGPPNAGKSTLANRLLGRSASITSDAPGTTRDWVSQMCALDGLPAAIIDTAGLGPTPDPLHAVSTARALAQAAAADLRLIVLDATTPLHPEERALINQLTAAGPGLLVLNRIDLPARKSAPQLQALLARPVLAVSALLGTGLEQLTRALGEALDLPKFENPTAAAFSTRQVERLSAAADVLPKNPALAATILVELAGPTDR